MDEDDFYEAYRDRLQEIKEIQARRGSTEEASISQTLGEQSRERSVTGESSPVS
jgi:hypothetical protein